MHIPLGSRVCSTINRLSETGQVPCMTLIVLTHDIRMRGNIETKSFPKCLEMSLGVNNSKHWIYQA